MLLPGPASCSEHYILLNMPAASKPKLQNQFPCSSHQGRSSAKLVGLAWFANQWVLGLNFPRIMSLCVYVGSMNKCIFIQLFSWLAPLFLPPFFFFATFDSSFMSCPVLSPSLLGFFIIILAPAMVVTIPTRDRRKRGLHGSSVYSFLFSCVLKHQVVLIEEG